MLNSAMDNPLPSPPIADTTCHKCLGTGLVLQPAPNTKGWTFMLNGPCPECSGTGKRLH